MEQLSEAGKKARGRIMQAIVDNDTKRYGMARALERLVELMEDPRRLGVLNAMAAQDAAGS
jgi:hypothetical protein